MRRLEHPNIVPLLGVAQGFGPILAIVLPWMSNGTLHSFLTNKGQSLTLADRLKLVSLKSVAGIGAVDHLQSHGIASGLAYRAFLSIRLRSAPSNIITCVVHSIPIFHGDLHSVSLRHLSYSTH